MNGHPQSRSSLDHVIGVAEQDRWHFEAERFRCRNP
jgi:hypothetical protein